MKGSFIPLEKVPEETLNTDTWTRKLESVP